MLSVRLTRQFVGSILHPRTGAEITAGKTPSDYGVPSHADIGYVDPARYGWSQAATGAVNYQAMVDAHAVAVAAAVGIRTPGGTFAYEPAATLALAVNWESATQTVLMVDMTGFNSVVFQMVASTVIRNVYLHRTGTKQGTAILQSPAVATDFSAYQMLERVWAIGFGVNLDIENFFFNEYAYCRFNDGGIGIRCEPATNGGDNGYVTTLSFYKVEAIGNDQNHYFVSTLQSRCVLFDGCGFENPQASPSVFVRVRELTFQGCYFEGAPAIIALQLADCSAALINPYFNGTGGLYLGTNTEATIIGYRVGSATDVLAGGDGTQQVTLIDCQFPAVGNSEAYADLVMMNTSINGARHKLWTNERGTATLTLTGCTTAPTVDAVYREINGVVHMTIPAVTATSNATSCTLTGVPAGIRPATALMLPVQLYYDNGASVTGIMHLSAAGVITLYVGVNGAGFTAAGGAKGLPFPITISWLKGV